MPTMGDAPSPAARPSGGRASLLFAAAGGTWAAAHGLDLLGPLQNATFVLLGTATVIATILAVRMYRPRLRWPWWLICGAMVIFLVAGVFRQVLHTLGNLTATRSIVPDLISLSGYVVIGIGLIGLARARRKGKADDFDTLLDAAVAGLAALTLAWVYLVDPTLFNRHSPVSVRILLSSYPPMSVFLVAIAARFAFNPGTKRALAYRFLLAALGFMLVGDALYMLLEIGVVSVPASIIDLPYALSYVAFGATVLHPSMRELCEPMTSEEVAPRRGRLALVGVALGLPVFVTVMRNDTTMGDRIALSAIVLMLTATAIWRLLRAVRGHARSEARLTYQARHDALTGLPNRLVVQEHLSRALAHVAARESNVAVLFLDVDRFKLVNDTLGHSRGDELLVSVARRLADHARPVDLVAHTGADEFVIVLGDVDDQAHAVELGETVRRSFQVPFTIRESEIYSSASLGVAFADGRNPNIDAESMLRDADIALYRAKDAGRDTVTVFESAMREGVTERLALERDLRHALERGQLHLHFQPVVQLPDGSIEGFEALLRWSHPSHGDIPPVRFIPIAEESGLIVEIGCWVLQEACRWLARWRRDVPLAINLYVAVNVSARQLRDGVFLETVKSALCDNDLPGEALALELTESLLMENPTAAANLLAALRQLDIRLLIDDFGTGYSSLAYLKRFPVDTVKIDQSFVEALDREDTSEESLVAAIIAMAGALGMTTIAEGVETARQESRLIELGCRAVQGFLYSRPVPPEAVPGMLRRFAESNGLVLRPIV
jgi:diguanylate cyclase